MELCEKLQTLRKQKGLTQEELAKALFVSRTAVSKWESGRGYPSIDSLKAIAAYFSITVDELLSDGRPHSVIQMEHAAKMRRISGLVLSLLDCASLLLIFIPLFGQREGDLIRQVPLFALVDCAPWLRVACFAVIVLPVVWGIIALALQNCNSTAWQRNKRLVSIAMSILGVLLFMAMLEPYAATCVLILLVIKGILLLKYP